MGELLLPLVVAGVAVWLWLKFRGGGAPATPARYANLGGGDGSFAVEVVGESHYQPALRAAAGKGEVRHRCNAELVMDDDNRYDKQAVSVWVDGRQVGHLSRSDARAYRKKVELHGRDIVGKCPAVIVGGGDGRSLGVWLDLPEA